jgi:glutamate synthase (NADPH/NADH) large chain
MTLVTQIGRERNIFACEPGHADQVMLNSPVLSQRKLRQLVALPEFAGAHARIDLYARDDEHLDAALERICALAEAAVRGGAVLVLLSDRHPAPATYPVHALLATGAVHRHLVKSGLRCDCNLIIETGTARDPHHFACLLGYGATAVYPYLAYQTLFDLGRAKIVKGKSGSEQAELGRSYRRGIKKGLLKIISKMGISTIGSYRGAQLFEIVGLADDVVARCFDGTPSRIGGAGFPELEADARERAARAADRSATLDNGGLLKFVHGGEYHAYNPDVVGSLQRAVRSGDYADYAVFAEHVNTRPPATLRDLLALVPAATPLPLDEV